MPSRAACRERARETTTPVAPRPERRGPRATKTPRRILAADTHGTAARAPSRQNSRVLAASPKKHKPAEKASCRASCLSFLSSSAPFSQLLRRCVDRLGTCGHAVEVSDCASSRTPLLLQSGCQRGVAPRLFTWLALGRAPRILSARCLRALWADYCRFFRIFRRKFRSTHFQHPFSRGSFFSLPCKRSRPSSRS